MTREEAFKKIIVMFKRGDITPQQLGTLMSQYYERYIKVPDIEPNEIFNGELPL